MSNFFRGLNASLLFAMSLAPALLLTGCGGSHSNSASGPTSVPNRTTTPTSNAIRVACVGDSITVGAGLSNRARDAFPAVLGRSLGAGYQVTNYGFSGATLLLATLTPYQRLPLYLSALESKSDIVIVALGTNDATYFHPGARASFVSDYKKLIADFRRFNASTRFYLCIPPAAFGSQADRARVIRTEIAPLIRQIARENEARIIDLFALTEGKPEWFPDELHPNAAGSREIAAEIQRALLLP